MKPLRLHPDLLERLPFSALGRAVWDETEIHITLYQKRSTFSALGRAVWDETPAPRGKPGMPETLSVLSVEPYGMKLRPPRVGQSRSFLSVLSVEPYGMKRMSFHPASRLHFTFSALGRAVWDETGTNAVIVADTATFQCSRSSRMG